MPKYDRKRVKLDVNDLTHGLSVNYVDVYPTATSASLRMV